MEYHEPYDELSASARELHRAISSLIEELDAVNWYHQRADVTTDPELRHIMLHNRDEEMEHAVMALEYVRRMLPELDARLRAGLFTDGGIVEDGHAGEPEGAGGAADKHGLGIGSLKEEH